MRRTKQTAKEKISLVERENEFIEREIITTLITNDEYIKSIARVYKPDCLESATAKLLAGWVLDYYSKYGKSPKKDIEGIFTSQMKNLDKERVEDIEEILSGLSDDYIKQLEEKSADFLMVSTFDHFRQCQMKAHSEKLNNCIARNDFEECYKIETNFTFVDMADAFEDSSINAWELYNMEDKKMDWLIKDFIPTGLTIIGGRSKVGKSYFALNLAMAIAQGKRLFGESGKDGYRGRKGAVLYLALEDPRERFKRRMREIDPTPNPDLLGKNLSPKFQWNKLTHGGLESIKQWVVKADKPRLIVIDVLARVWNKKSGTGGGGLYAEEYGIYAPLAEVAHHNGISILVITHTTKSKAQDVFDEILGGMGTQGPADNLIVLSNVPGRINQKQFSIRGKDIEDRHLLFETPEGPARWVCLGDADEAQKTEQRQSIYDYLEMKGEMSYSEIEQAARDKVINARVNSINTILRKMVADGELEQTRKYGKYSIKGMVGKSADTGIAEKLKRGQEKGRL